MKKLISALESIGNLLEKMINGIVFWLSFLSILFFSYLVVLRYVFRTGYDWGDELLLFLLTTAVLLSAPMATRKNELTSVEFLMQKLSGRSKSILLISTTVVSLVSFSVMGWAGIKMVNILYFQGTASSSSLELPSWIPFSMMPIGLLLCSFFFIEKLTKALINKGSDSQS